MPQKFDPYEILGVRHNARSETIHAAYRSLAKSHHPDGGGNSSEFERIKLAHDVLMDAERRDKFDRTGIVDEGAADNAMAAILAQVAMVLEMAFAAIPPGTNAENLDMVRLMRDKLEEHRGGLAKQREAVALSRAAFSRLIGRFGAKRGPNHLDGMVRYKVAMADQLLANIDGQLAIVPKAAEVLAQCNWRMDVLERLVYNPQQSTRGWFR